MKQHNFSSETEVLTTLVGALGAGLGAWGTINLLEAYKRNAEKDEITAEYRSRINELDLLLQGLFEDKATGKITAAQYQAKCAEYDAEMDTLFEALHDLDKDIAAQKRHGMEQLLTGGRLALFAPFAGSPEDRQFALDYTDKKHRANGEMPV